MLEVLIGVDFVVLRVGVIIFVELIVLGKLSVLILSLYVINNY